MQRLKFGLFLVVVLALPWTLMAQRSPQLVDLGKLTMILGPAIAGLILLPGTGDRGRRADLRRVAEAAGITLLIAVAALSVALLVGAADFQGRGVSVGAALAPVAVTVVTSVLEELGWSGGGLGLAVGAFGRRWGVSVLGLVWAAWHLGPALLKIGLFPELETAPPLMLVSFVVSCLIYRELLTTLRERANTWWAGAAGHVAPNFLMAGLIALGLGGFYRPGAWPFFPAPGGLVFPLLSLIALIWLRRSRDDVAA